MGELRLWYGDEGDRRPRFQMIGCREPGERHVVDDAAFPIADQWLGLQCPSSRRPMDPRELNRAQWRRHVSGAGRLAAKRGSNERSYEAGTRGSRESGTSHDWNPTIVLLPALLLEESIVASRQVAWLACSRTRTTKSLASSQTLRWSDVTMGRSR